MNIFDRFRVFLGLQRFRAFAILLVATGLLSFVLAFVNETWAVAAQTVLALTFLFGAVVIIGGRMDAGQRLKWISILAPAFGLVLLGVLFFPEYRAFALGGAFGWVLIGLFLFGNNRAPQQYRTAVKALRKNNYAEAVEAMDGLIKSEPDEPNHYRFRAELLRMWGKTGRARRDYQTMIERSHTPAEEAVAYNGIAEVELQSGNLDEALSAAQKAYELAPNEWVAAYNLGMIEDRLHHSQNVLKNLDKALQASIPDSRHRLLVYLWMARAHARLGNIGAAEETVKLMKKEREGLREWQTIINDEQAAVLRDVLEEDIHLAADVISGETQVTKLGDGAPA
jgi:Tfp pilus assembly protein PilF